MKQKVILVVFLLLSQVTFGQTYEGLQKLGGVNQNVYFSPNAKERAIKILDNVAKADEYFQKEFSVKPTYTLLVLSPSDWKKYAHPNAIYGIPHFLPDGRLVVASENNDFWKRNAPPINTLPKELAQKMKDAYTDKNGEINLTDAFDLLAVHELGHAFQTAAGIAKQRNWLSELFCNVLLHTYLAEKNPKQLQYITTFTQVAVQSFPPQMLKYTKLEEFEKNYNLIAQKHPDNYGWYQCRFHVVAGEIYDNGGVDAMRKMWATLLAQKEKLSDEELANLLKQAHPALAQAITNLNK
jgi:hypothetical protein